MSDLVNIAQQLIESEKQRLSALEAENEKLKAELDAERRGWPHEQPLADEPMGRQIVLLNRQVAEKGASINQLELENNLLREGLSKVASMVGGAASKDCSVGFLAVDVPREVGLAMRQLELEKLKAERALSEGDGVWLELLEVAKAAEMALSDIETAKRKGYATAALKSLRAAIAKAEGKPTTLTRPFEIPVSAVKGEQ